MSGTIKHHSRRDVLRWAGLGTAAVGAASILPVGAAFAEPGLGRKIYVRAGAEPGGDGSTPQRAFPTLQEAHDVTEPGDTVLIMNGTYRDAGGFTNQGPLHITRSGAPGAPITYTAFPGHRPVIGVTDKGWNGIRVTGASYLVFRGLTLVGNSASLRYEDAYAMKDTSNPTYNANGFFVADAPGGGGALPHHITVEDMLVHHWPGGGIGATNTDYLTVRRNVVHSNAWYSIYANSGITTLTPHNFDDSTEYKNFFEQNLCYRNESFIPWKYTGKISDGNGIIIDSTIDPSGVRPNYLGRTLVANNICVDNGGSGIHAYKAAHVDIVNNTAYLNSASPALQYAPVHANSCVDVNLLNNLVYCREGEPTNMTVRNVDVTYDYNVYFNGAAPEVMGEHDIVADPMFVNPGVDPTQSSLYLREGSPAIGSGTTHLAPERDFDGKTRPPGQGVDRGAYRYRPKHS